MNLNIFKPEDFNEPICTGAVRTIRERLAEKANQILNERKNQLIQLDIQSVSKVDQRKLSSTGQRIRSIGFLIASLDQSAGLPADYDLWYEIGGLLEELGEIVVEASCE